MTTSDTAGRARLTFAEHGPHQIVFSLWRHRLLISRLARREVESRYRGSLLGLVWTIITPLLMLAVFTFVFSVVFKVRWNVPIADKSEFALILFAGLIVFQFFADCIGRASSLMRENVSYIKKIVFPLEAMSWVVLLSALFNAFVSTIVLLVVHVVLVGAPPWTAIFIPVVFAPLALLMVGGIWLLASVGIYIPDVRQVIAVVITLLMFLSPIFYPVSALPENFQSYLLLNPLTYIMDQARTVLLYGRAPNFGGLALYSLVALAVAWLGYAWFAVTKRGFADVV